MCTLGSYGPLRGGGGVEGNGGAGRRRGGGVSYSLFSLILSLPKGT